MAAMGPRAILSPDAFLNDAVIDSWRQFKSTLRDQKIPLVRDNVLLGTHRAFIEGLRPHVSPEWTEVPASVELIMEAVAGGPRKVTKKTRFRDIASVVSCFFVRTDGPRVDSHDLKAAADAFDKTSFQNVGYVDAFVAELTDSAQLWAEGKRFYAPLSSLVNASMIGKSRLMAEAASRGVFVFLVCLRPHVELQYRPPRTPAIAELLTNNGAVLRGPGDAEAFGLRSAALFLASMKKLLVWLQSADAANTEIFGQEEAAEAEKRLRALTSAWFRSTTEDKTFWTSLAAETDAEVLELHRAFAATSLTHHEFVDQIWKRRDMQTVGESIEKRIRELTLSEAPSFLVAFMVDEARAMIEAGTFVPFRRATRLFPKQPRRGLRLFCVVTDTTSKVSNFSPSKELLESERAREIGTETFRPFWVIESLDSWWDAATGVLVPVAENGENITQLQVNSLREALIGPTATTVDYAAAPAVSTSSPQVCVESTLNSGVLRVRLVKALSMALLEEMDVMALFGRPVFFSFLFFRAAEAGEAPQVALVELMKSKLLKVNPLVVKQDPKALKQAAAVAVLGFLVSIEVSASSELATELASGHLRLVAGISEDRHMVYTMEVSEPVIAMAAHYLLMDKVVSWSALLLAFCSEELTNATMTGFRGEVGAQILLMACWQKLMFARIRENPALFKYRFFSVSVLDFLSALLGPEVELPISAELKAALARGFLRLYSFMKTFVEPSQAMLFEHLIRGSGIFCRENQKAIDAIIPAWYAEEGSECPPHRQVVSQERTRGILVQVRLRKKYQTPKKKEDWLNSLATLKLLKETASDKKAPWVGLFLELGGPADAQEDSQAKEKNQQTHPAKKGKTLPYEVVETEFGCLAVFMRVNCLSAVDPTLACADTAFRTLLESVIDPADSSRIPSDLQLAIRRMFKTQPYMTR